MKQLDELERKILCIVSRNKELREDNELLKMENEQLREQTRKLEATLLSRDENSESLVTEKKAIKNSIEELLTSLSSLEDTEEETPQNN